MKQVGKNLEAPPSVQRLVRILWLDCFVCSSVRFTGFSVSLHICASLPETEAGDLRRVCALQITLFFCNVRHLFYLLSPGKEIK